MIEVFHASMYVSTIYLPNKMQHLSCVLLFININFFPTIYILLCEITEDYMLIEFVVSESTRYKNIHFSLINSLKKYFIDVCAIIEVLLNFKYGK